MKYTDGQKKISSTVMEGKGKQMSHGEHEAMVGSLRKAGKHLARQDEMGEYMVRDESLD